MIDKYKKLKIPMPEKMYILPEAREKLFMHMINEYKTRCPGLTLLYAYLNHDAEFPVDYLLIFKAMSDDNRVSLILFETPYLYSDRTLPGYRYCLRNNLLDDFFQESTDQMPRLSRGRFNEYITTMLELSMNKESPEYWRAPGNASKLGKGLVDLSVIYTRK